MIAYTEQDVRDATTLILARTQLSARDALHVAVMQRHRIAEILTFDRGFDAVPGIIRLPARSG
ncbi:MAG: type II toxin-antitoxin system VapC family toxin [Solirubrobacteraceae bacterium]